MRKILSEKNIVVLLFVLVLVSFALAQEDSRKIEKLYNGGAGVTAENLSLKNPSNF